ncbi:hypothetical protein P7K49_011984 [Saguinus oedipus]|uniref:Uncharacterized protein n=1 Tax=Saguinus oedipus TaxID=9490 RepID=A0ABQ9VVR1_SAGOE|nr:hypothetical protein P7K49_011984 [Saguinus oedipus]
MFPESDFLQKGGEAHQRLQLQREKAPRLPGRGCPGRVAVSVRPRDAEPPLGRGRPERARSRPGSEALARAQRSRLAPRFPAAPEPATRLLGVRGASTPAEPGWVPDSASSRNNGWGCPEETLHRGCEERRRPPWRTPRLRPEPRGHRRVFSVGSQTSVLGFAARVAHSRVGGRADASVPRGSAKGPRLASAACASSNDPAGSGTEGFLSSERGSWTVALGENNLATERR